MELKILKKYFAKVKSAQKDGEWVNLELESNISFSDCTQILPGHNLVMCIMPPAFSEEAVQQGEENLKTPTNKTQTKITDLLTKYKDDNSYLQRSQKALLDSFVKYCRIFGCVLNR